MLNTYWEEIDMPLDILKFHEEEMERWSIPNWMKINCPYCGKELPLRSIRSIAIKFNTRNIGDLALEVHCDSCLKMDIVYFRKEVDNIKDFIPFLSGEKEPKNAPIIEEKMYKMQYNNAVEKMISDKGAGNVNI